MTHHRTIIRRNKLTHYTGWFDDDLRAAEKVRPAREGESLLIVELRATPATDGQIQAPRAGDAVQGKEKWWIVTAAARKGFKTGDRDWGWTHYRLICARLATDAEAAPLDEAEAADHARVMNRMMTS